MINSIVTVTAFFDINRENWAYLNRNAEYYLNSFKNMTFFTGKLIVFMDDRYIHTPFIKNYIDYLNKHNDTSKIFIFINKEWLYKHCDSWKKNYLSEKIMKSTEFTQLVEKRISMGVPETIYPEYNTINHSKIDFIKYAIDNSLIKENEFICWCDIGYYYSILHNNCDEFPYAELDLNKFNLQKMNFCIKNMIFNEDTNMFYTVVNSPEIFTGCFFAGNTESMLQYHKLYHISLDELYENNLSDDDQHIALRCYLKQPDLFHLSIFYNCWPQALTYFQINIQDKQEFIKHYLDKIQNGLFVEIGVCHGTTSDFILTHNKTCHLYCVDPYVSYDDYEDACANEVNDGLYLSTKTRLESKYPNRVTFIRKFSGNAITFVPDELDFVYIDGNHKYEFVINDLELWYYKLKKGGFIICDDAHDTDESLRDNEGNMFIQWNSISYGKYGVYHACKDFTKKYNIPYFKFNAHILIFKPVYI